MPARTLLATLVLILAASTSTAQHDAMPGMPAASPDAVPLYHDLGDWTHPVTASPQAQRYFDQGLRLYYAFNHDEAIRAFREAARLDPACAMAWWGVAIACGPNINMPMDDDHGRTANEALAKARALAPKAGAADRDYITALAARYSADPAAPRAALDSAYARAMGDLARRHPDDVDAQVLHAESMLDLNPWNQWTQDGQPNPGTNEIVAILEAQLRRSPRHPGANHFYIHTIEASPHPERAAGAARALETLMPGAGHLVHMPSHIYARTGRYDDARLANEKATAVDEKYIAEQKPQGAYPMMYYNHNIQFIWFTSCMEGRSAEALAAARKIEANLPADMLRQMTMLEGACPMVIMTLARFGRWDEVLADPAPPSDLRFASALAHYARGLARAAKGDAAKGRAELDSLRAIAPLVPADQPVSINTAGPILRMASSALAGELARRERRTSEAVASYRAAVATEDSLHYDEPPTWYYPMRHLLGAALLEAGNAREAEAVYRDDQARHPENGWSLLGLAKALRAEGHADEAARTEARFAKAWSGADVKPPGSAY